VRTTINLPDALLGQAKRQAARENLTLGQLVERSLRATLLRREPEIERPPFRLVTFGKGGLRPGFSFGRLKEILEDEEVERVSSGLAGRAADSDDAPP
jgi:hypothetical protein